MKFNVEEYLSEVEMKKIAEKAFYEQCLKQFSDKKNVERIISNSAFNGASAIVSDYFGDELQEKINDGVISAIEGIDSFLVFKKADAWDRDSTGAFEMLKIAVANNRGLIEEKATEIIKSANIRDSEEYLMEILRDRIADKLFTNAEVVK